MNITTFTSGTMRAVSILVSVFFVATSISICFCNGNTTTQVGCIEREREALLRFKHDLVDPSNRLASWSHNNEDCCKWVGISCHHLTGHVLGIHLQNPYADQFYESFLDSEAYLKYMLSGKVSSALINLTHLSSLDLSYNSFSGLKIPVFFGSLESLRYLNLSHAGFGGLIPHQLGNISNLSYLDLNNKYEHYHLYVENLQWLSSLLSLKFLGMNHANLTKASDWLQVTSTLPSLEELHLSGCQLPSVHLLQKIKFSSLSKLDLSSNSWGSNLLFSSCVFGFNKLVFLDLSYNELQGPIPSGLQNITSLMHLDLSNNYFNSSIPNWLYGFRNLEFLSLVSSELQGKISNAIENLTSTITTLDLSYNKNLEVGNLRSFGTLCNLKFLSLSRVKINQEFSSLFGCASNRLEYLALDDTLLFGQLTDRIGEFEKLTILCLTNNSIFGPIPVSMEKLMRLEVLDLSYNNLSGSIPESYGQLRKLETLDISNNKLTGVASEAHFANLTKLDFFSAYGNSIHLNVSSSWVPPFQALDLRLGSWYLGPRFPQWLLSQKFLQSLDISNANISDTIPHWFWNLSSQYNYLNLSHNRISGKLPNNLGTGQGISMIDLSSNNFKGPLPPISSNVSYLDISNNWLSGSIFNFLCNQLNETKQMISLNLEGNHLSGKLPDCWTGLPYLEGINLSKNNFTGNIPISMGNLRYLVSLHLRNNKLSGVLPRFLSNCTQLQTIDISENELIGSIPSWIGERLSKLMILNLRSNKLGGLIPNNLCYLFSLRILDLAYNNLCGTIPRCVNNFSAMAGENYWSDIDFLFRRYIGQVESAILMNKGKMVTYSTILKYVKVLDLSKNRLLGEVPLEVTSLHGLQSLNLSNNLLTGKIPKNIGAMKSLESLDLSSNQLSGEIPSSMSTLTFLGVLNLSHNNLRGEIPSSTQLQSFDASSFTGNQLCGPPLHENCSTNGVVPSVESGRRKAKNGIQIDWFYMFMALGFVVGFWGAVGSLFFCRSWRILFFEFVDRIWLSFLLFVNRVRFFK